MAAREVPSSCSAGVIDIVCGTLQAKLITKDLSSGSSPCIQFGSLLLSPCDFQRQAGKAAARNWKNSIRYMKQPLARALESYVNLDGKRCCRFIGLSVAPPSDIGDDTRLSARPSTSTSVDWESSDPLQPDDSGSVYFDGMAHDQLPDYPPKASPNFHWSSLDSAAFSQALDSAYLEVAHWRKNCFDVPRGLVGKQFVSELARLFRAVGEGSALESVALKAIFVACILLLQKLSRSSKPKDHTSHLQRRLQLWNEGDISGLLEECRAIQSRLTRVSTPTSDLKLARSFANLMFEGKTMQCGNKAIYTHWTETRRASSTNRHC